jgi:hypothetical protein
MCRVERGSTLGTPGERQREEMELLALSPRLNFSLGDFLAEYS